MNMKSGCISYLPPRDIWTPLFELTYEPATAHIACLQSGPFAPLYVRMMESYMVSGHPDNKFATKDTYKTLHWLCSFYNSQIHFHSPPMSIVLIEFRKLEIPSDFFTLASLCTTLDVPPPCLFPHFACEHWTNVVWNHLMVCKSQEQSFWEQIMRLIIVQTPVITLGGNGITFQVDKCSICIRMIEWHVSCQ